MRYEKINLGRIRCEKAPQVVPARFKPKKDGVWGVLINVKVEQSTDVLVNRKLNSSNSISVANLIFTRYIIWSWPNWHVWKKIFAIPDIWANLTLNRSDIKKLVGVATFYASLVLQIGFANLTKDISQVRFEPLIEFHQTWIDWVCHQILTKKVWLFKMSSCQVDTSNKRIFTLA